MELPDLLAGDATIVGYHDRLSNLAISHKCITTRNFMEAHIINNSKHDDQVVPPFYFPVPQVSGPDIIFYIRVKDKMFPVFVHLKLRQIFGRSDTEKDLTNVSEGTMENRMAKEQERQLGQDPTITTETEHQQPLRLRDCCPADMYISMIIAYPTAAVKLQIKRRDPEPESKGPERVSIHINDRNFRDIFPAHHVEYLHGLTGYKRRAQDFQPRDQRKKAKADVLDA
ncbi:hypothetical protein BGX33_008289 [Mortierella sp. NVP41]|nr:hypothetical protein BGX33_008289 [Mortierella sp. NVP41]